MNTGKTSRRNFVKTSAISAAALALTGTGTLASVNPPAKNKLPRWKGFNLLDLLRKY
jgi:hypothetical protein